MCTACVRSGYEGYGRCAWKVSGVLCKFIHLKIFHDRKVGVSKFTILKVFSKDSMIGSDGSINDSLTDHATNKRAVVDSEYISDTTKPWDDSDSFGFPTEISHERKKLKL